MYDQRITDRFLEAQMRVDPSFEATYHRLSDVEAMIGLLDDKYDLDAKRQRDDVQLTPDEQAFIHNERMLCTHDFSYFTSRYFKIIDFETRTLKPLEMNLAQRIVVDVWAEMESKRWAIMMMQLKARRL